MSIFTSRRILHPGSQGAISGGLGGIAASAPFAISAGNFDGSTDAYQTPAASLGTSMFNDKIASFFVSFKRSANGSKRPLLSQESSNPKVDIFFNASDEFEIAIRNSGGTVIFLATSTTTITDTLWHTVLVSFDLTDTGKRHMLVDGVEDSPTYTTYTNDNISWNPAAVWDLGKSIAGGTVWWSGDIAVIWLTSHDFIDFSVQANVDKFIKVGEPTVPIFLGASGRTPTGTEVDLLSYGWPIGVLHHVAGTDWQPSGTPVEASTSPTD